MVHNWLSMSLPSWELLPTRGKAKRPFFSPHQHGLSRELGCALTSRPTMMTVQVIIPKGPTVSFNICRKLGAKKAEPLGSIWGEFDLNTEIINYRGRRRRGQGRSKKEAREVFQVRPSSCLSDRNQVTSALLHHPFSSLYTELTGKLPWPQNLLLFVHARTASPWHVGSRRPWIKTVFYLVPSHLVTTGT